MAYVTLLTNLFRNCESPAPISVKVGSSRRVACPMARAGIARQGVEEDDDFDEMSVVWAFAMLLRCVVAVLLRHLRGYACP